MHPAIATTPLHTRIFGLDLLRMWAILSVVLGHARGLMEVADTDFPWIPVGDGVEMFFALSGYLIGGILIKNFVVDGPIGFKTLGNFLMRRWLRTLPNYYLVLLINILLVYLGWSTGLWKFVTADFFYFGQNLAWSFEGFFWESWSLAIEEWFYLSFPLLLMLLFVLSKRADMRKWLFLIGIVVFLAVPMLLRLLRFSPEIDSYQWDIALRKVVVYRLDAIAWGLLMVWIARFAPLFWKQFRWPMFALGFGMFLFLSYFHMPLDSYFVQVWVFTLKPLAYALWLPILASITTAPRWLSQPIVYISKISYSIYLIHLGIILDLTLKWFKPTTATEAWITLPIYLLIVLVLSNLLYDGWERPMMQLRDRLSTKEQ